MHILKVATSARETMIDITRQLEAALHAVQMQSGAMLVYTPHTTTGLTINEGADPDVCHDILAHLRTIIPRQADFHHAEGNSDAHIKASLLGSSVHIIVDNGILRLGTWQRVFLAEFDGPRARNIWVTFLS